MIYSLYVINKSGGVIFQKDFIDAVALEDPNDYMRVGSMFHTFNVFAYEMAPVKNSGFMNTFETEYAMIRCYQTKTGTKFFVIGDKEVPKLDTVRLYATYDADILVFEGGVRPLLRLCIEEPFL